MSMKKRMKVFIKSDKVIMKINFYDKSLKTNVFFLSPKELTNNLIFIDFVSLVIGLKGSGTEHMERRKF